jgi:hypothetical protein
MPVIDNFQKQSGLLIAPQTIDPKYHIFTGELINPAAPDEAIVQGFALCAAAPESARIRKRSRSAGTARAGSEREHL